MYSFRQSRFGGGQDPWFRVGTWDVGSSGIAALAVLFGMILVAVEGRTAPISRWLIFDTSEAARGQLWRLLTWFVPSAISPWTIVSAFMIYLMGSQIEGALGRVKMAQFLAALLVIPSALALTFHAIGAFGTPVLLAGGGLLGQMLFFAFVLYLPGVRFFFGIPGWVIAAVIVAIQMLGYLADRNLAGALHFALTLILIVVLTSAFGLADDVVAVPKIGSLGRPAARSSSAQPSSPQFDDARFRELDIDPILDQIAAFGVESLSDEQRRTLESFSKRKGNKRGR